MTKLEKSLLVIYSLFISALTLLLIIPYPSYTYNVGVKKENSITFSIDRSKFSDIQESKLYINEKEYDYKIINKEEKETNYIITIEMKQKLKEKHDIIEMVYQGKKKSILKKFIKKIRKEWFLS